MTQGMYSIKDLERLTGIKAHTIRIWEKRYGVVKPNRTHTNIRYYNDLDLKKLLNIAILINHGFKISYLATLPDSTLNEKVVDITYKPSNAASQIESLILAMISLDEIKFEKTISMATINLGFENTILEIIYPFLERIGILWQTGSINPAQEHFVSNLLRQKLLVAIDGQGGRPKADAKRFMLFLPENELHELGLLFYSYLVRKSGNKIIYLGQSVPFNDLIEVSKAKEPDVLVTSITSPIHDQSTQAYIDHLAATFPKQKIFITGIQMQNNTLRLPSNVKKISNVTEFKEELTANFG